MTAIEVPSVGSGTILCGQTLLTIRVPESYIESRRIAFGDDFRPEYQYRITGKRDNQGGVTYFIECWDERRNGRWVYAGIVNPSTGTIRMTRSSAFPEHATRIRAANFALSRLLTGRVAELKQMEWSGSVKVLSRDPESL